jgi:starvation-inducible DNA-binding protein
VADNDADYVTPPGVLAELRDENQQRVSRVRATHAVVTSTATWRPPA